MNMNRTRVLFGKNVDNEDKMEVAVFHENQLMLCSGQATFLRKVIPTVPNGWGEIAKGNLVVSSELPFFDGNSLEPVSSFFDYEFFHYEKQENVVYNLPQFKQEEEEEKKKNMRFKVLLDDVTKNMVGTCVTNRNNASFFFGCGGRHFVTLPKILKPLYDFRSGSAILSSKFELEDDQFLMAWRETNNSDGVMDTFFQIYKNII